MYGYWEQSLYHIAIQIFQISFSGTVSENGEIKQHCLQFENSELK